MTEKIPEKVICMECMRHYFRYNSGNWSETELMTLVKICLDGESITSDCFIEHQQMENIFLDFLPFVSFRKMS